MSDDPDVAKILRDAEALMVCVECMGHNRHAVPLWCPVHKMTCVVRATGVVPEAPEPLG